MDTSTQGPFEQNRNNQIQRKVRHADRIAGFDENVWYALHTRRQMDYDLTLMLGNVSLDTLPTPPYSLWLI